MDKSAGQPASEPKDEQPSTQTKKPDQEPTVPWTFQQESPNNQAAITTQPLAQRVEPISWTASEFIHHQKTTGWYTMLALVGLILAGIVYLITHDLISTSVIIFAAIIFGVYAARKPRTLSYKLDGDGLTVGEKFYHYDSFKSYAVAEDSAIPSIELTPLKQFMPAISLYYEPKDEAKITSVLASRLPVETHKRDAVDSLMHRIRF